MGPTKLAFLVLLALLLGDVKARKDFVNQCGYLRPPVVPQSFLGAPPSPKAEGRDMEVISGQAYLSGGIYKKKSKELTP